MLVPSSLPTPLPGGPGQQPFWLSPAQVGCGEHRRRVQSGCETEQRSKPRAEGEPPAAEVVTAVTLQGPHSPGRSRVVGAGCRAREGGFPASLQSADSVPRSPGHLLPQPQRPARAGNHRTRDAAEPPAFAEGLLLFPGTWSTKVPPVRLLRVRITLAPSLTRLRACPPAEPCPAAAAGSRAPWVCPVGLGQGPGLLGGASQKGVAGSNFPAGAAIWEWRVRAALDGEPQAP